MKSIAVFCGSSMGKGNLYRNTAAELGSTLAKIGITLVYGGSNIGLMKIVADAALEHGGNVIGVMPHILVDKELVHKGISEIHIVSDMQERKSMMAALADGFITLPGGFGTLDELAEMLSWYQLEIHNKPSAILNVNGYFDHLLSFLDVCVEEKFLRHEHRKNIVISDNIDNLLDILLNFIPVEVDNKWVEELKRM